MVDARKFLGGKWLRKKHIDPTRDTTFTIVDVVQDHYEPDEDDEDANGTIEQERLALRFNEIDKQLGLNETNNEMMIEMLGHETDEWKGKRIDLYVDSSVVFKGKRCGGVRIRPKLSTGAPKTRRKTKRT